MPCQAPDLRLSEPTARALYSGSATPDPGILSEILRDRVSAVGWRCDTVPRLHPLSARAGTHTLTDLHMRAAALLAVPRLRIRAPVGALSGTGLAFLRCVDPHRYLRAVCAFWMWCAVYERTPRLRIRARIDSSRSREHYLASACHPSAHHVTWEEERMRLRTRRRLITSQVKASGIAAADWTPSPIMSASIRRAS